MTLEWNDLISDLKSFWLICLTLHKIFPGDFIYCVLHQIIHLQGMQLTTDSSTPSMCWLAWQCDNRIREPKSFRLICWTINFVFHLNCNENINAAYLHCHCSIASMTNKESKILKCTCFDNSRKAEILHEISKVMFSTIGEGLAWTAYQFPLWQQRTLQGHCPKWVTDISYSFYHFWYEISHYKNLKKNWLKNI